MKKTEKRDLAACATLLTSFALWTLVILRVDVRAIGPKETSVGLAAFNGWFHRLTGVHMILYTVTDWLGLVPILVCVFFGGMGAVQLFRRKSLLKVDPDLILLGGYYLLVIAAYLFFEMIPINFRPVLIEGVLEASYPSSTTLLVLSVMPTLAFQAGKRLTGPSGRRTAAGFAAAFSTFMVIGRLVSGVHWVTDIIGSVLLSSGLFMMYRFSVRMAGRKQSGGAEKRK